ncbi:hypothetical protein HRG_013458 [Hirsutella rhossiliensis]
MDQLNDLGGSPQQSSDWKTPFEKLHQWLLDEKKDKSLHIEMGTPLFWAPKMGAQPKRLRQLQQQISPRKRIQSAKKLTHVSSSHY